MLSAPGSTIVHIAVDAMGGDYAPAEIVRGAFEAATQDGASVLLVGQAGPVESELAKLGAQLASDERVRAEA